MNKLKREVECLERGRFELERRRYNWRYHTCPKTIEKLNTLIKELADINYPYGMRCGLGSRDLNLQTVQLTLSKNCTGVYREEIKRNHVNGTKEIKSSKVIESGCSLVFSQGISGTIAVIFYPYKSEYLERHEDFVFLYTDLLPESITESFLEHCFAKFLLYVRFSSLYGYADNPNWLDKIKLKILLAKDIREKYKRSKKLINLDSKWLEILVNITLSSVVASLIALFFNKT
ncbi:hypothetical protein [Vibrio vulnificus]|uniref:hypothetical protein n=1 Tax=Vibrio vulnificus TaxID=672 RepID=UPI001A2645B4|nr:hypothetical protein [Vibrio vulnificus]WIL72936.1 hypothetical protein QPX65_08120 [Vibrio vulnificus]HAS6046178.1 hypothetical protein [Vibrio vulnificus]